MHSKKHRATSILLPLSPAIAVIIVLFGGGLLLGSLQALGYDNTLGLNSLTLRHFTNVVSAPEFYSSLLLTFYIALVSTSIAAIFSIILAHFLLRNQTKSKILHFLLQIPLAVPHLVVGISMLFLLTPSGFFSRLFSSLGLLSTQSAFPLLVHDTYGISILTTYIWKEIPFITFAILPVLKNVNTELQEAGKTLKADSWQRFRFITLPLITPALSAASLIVFAFTFGAFEIPYLLGKSHPVTMPVWTYRLYSDIDLTARPEGIALGLIIAIIVFAFLLLAQFLTQHSMKNGASYK